MSKKFDDDDESFWIGIGVGRTKSGELLDTSSSSFATQSFTSNGNGGGHSGRCYDSHPSLPLGEGLVVYGGSCGHPKVLDADIYVALQAGNYSGQATYPWNKTRVVTEVAYAIQDMHAPKNPQSFMEMITWLVDQIRSGKKVHVGCIGGHGRTGQVLVALAAEMLGEVDAITYVRKNYCDKAVESKEQVDFLVKHYKVLPVAGHKEHFKAEKQYTRGGGAKNWPSQTIGKSKGQGKLPFKNSAKTYKHVPSARCIWDEPVKAGIGTLQSIAPGKYPVAEMAAKIVAMREKLRAKP